MRHQMIKAAAAVLVISALAACSSGSGPVAPLATTPAVLTAPDPGTTPLDPAKAAILQAVLTKVVSQYAATPDSESAARGITAAVVTDQWTWSGAAGQDAVGTDLLPNTSMAVASITKTFIAAEVLLLAKARKVDLDKPLSAYVKHKLTANEATVRQHLSMTSGVPDFRPDDYTRLDKAIAAAPAKHWTAEQALTYDTAQPGQPGSPYNYSNPSYILLGLLIDKITGEPFQSVLRRDLATPAGLERAAFQDAEKPQPPVAKDRTGSSCGAAFDGYIPCRAIASLTAANAGLAADAPTVARWGYQLYGDRVVPAELVRQMTAGDGQYGLGTMRYSQQFGLGDAFGHGGNDPGYSSLMVAIPGHHVALSILLANGNKDAGRIAEELVTAIQPLLGH
ncbi:serine hydrolase domain-containing protein [Kribbella sp. NPDC006257]|uniref:serine hydrolase domain-containing protein n=1 Tax=Kribbella sp. NPDC006257 TaxID=3156738 RepID=UPI0033A047E0